MKSLAKDIKMNALSNGDDVLGNPTQEMREKKDDNGTNSFRCTTDFETFHHNISFHCIDFSLFINAYILVAYLLLTVGVH